MFYKQFLESSRNSPFVAHCDNTVQNDKVTTLVPGRNISAAAAASPEGGNWNS